MKIGVLSIQGAVSEHLEQLQKTGIEALPVKTGTSLSQVCGLVIPGGESTTIGKLISASGLTEPIITGVRNRKLALLGTCAGMVLMASRVVDGTVDQPKLDLMDICVRRNAFGRQRESFETSLEFKSFDRPLAGVFIRSPLIVEAGPGIEILAELPEGIVAARQGNLLALSFHPELTEDLRIHRYFIEMCKQVLV